MTTFWEVALGVGAVLGGFILYVASKIVAHLVGEEVEGRLDQIGYALLRLACRRLPAALRDSYYQEWAAELDAYFLTAPEWPLTRLYRSLAFAAPFLTAGRAIARMEKPEAFESDDEIEDLVDAVTRVVSLIARAGIVASGTALVVRWPYALLAQKPLALSMVVLLGYVWAIWSFIALIPAIRRRVLKAKDRLRSALTSALGVRLFRRVAAGVPNRLWGGG